MTKAQTARITLNLQNATLEQAMDKIKAQTRYLFINRNVEDLESRKVSINVSNELITKVLDQLFTPFDIGYDIDGRSIFIYKQQAAAARPVPVSGRVTDASGQPIIGASVIVRGTTLGVSTDAEGRFSLEVPAPAASQTLAILEYRRKYGKIKGLSQLSLWKEFSEKDLKRLAPYLSFE